MKTQRIEFGGQEFHLHPHRALIWPARKTLIIADLHLGKASIFRERGLPVPAGTTAHDLARLGALIKTVQPHRLLILGDLVHGRIDDESAVVRDFAAWRSTYAELMVELVRGNHDRHCPTLPNGWQSTEHAASLIEQGLTFTHAPLDDTEILHICGHVHPSAPLADFDGGRARVPCFVVERHQIILPRSGDLLGRIP